MFGKLYRLKELKEPAPAIVALPGRGRYSAWKAQGDQQAFNTPVRVDVYEWRCVPNETESFVSFDHLAQIKSAC